MKVVATAIGFYGQLRQPGDDFEVPDDEKPSSWFKPVDPVKPKEKKAAPSKAENEPLA